MQLITLGTGTCVPSLKRSASSNFLKIKKTNILVDCGSGTLKQLEKAKLSYKDVDIVFFTHFHTDHISDVNALIHALNWTPDYDRKRDLLLVGPFGFKKFYKNYLQLVSGKPRPNTYKIRIKEIKKKLKFQGFIVESANTVHAEPSIAYKFIEGKKSIVISGDCDFDRELIELSKNVDVLVLECSFPNNRKIEGHLVSKECGLIAKEANVRKLVLTHFYPVSTAKERLNETKKVFKKTILAKDLMKIKI